MNTYFSQATLKGKNLLSRESKFFLLRVTHYEKGVKSRKWLFNDTLILSVISKKYFVALLAHNKIEKIEKTWSLNNKVNYIFKT